MLVLLAMSAAETAHAEVFIAPYSGNLYMKCTGGDSPAPTQFGTGTSTANFTAFLNGIPGSCPTAEVLIGSMTAGQAVPFAMKTTWNGQSYWAFSTATDQPSIVAFSDPDNSLKMGGRIIQQTGTNTWLMHLDDAASYLGDDDDNDILIQLRMDTTAAPPSGGSPPTTSGPCSASMLNGTYYYVLSGSMVTGSQSAPYAELGKLAADGKGNVSGQAHTTTGGQVVSYNLAGTYSIQGNCTGSMSLTAGGQQEYPIIFQIVNGGEGAIVAFSDPTEVVTGQAYRQTSTPGTGQCGLASLSGSYGYLLTGVQSLSGRSVVYADAGALTADGKGHMTTTSMVNANGTSVATNGTGTYSMAADCSGTAVVGDQYGTMNYVFAVVDGGEGVLFLATSSGYTVAGLAQPQFRLPAKRLRVVR
jgi:hypothetical protein